MQPQDTDLSSATPAMTYNDVLSRRRTMPPMELNSQIAEFRQLKGIIIILVGDRAKSHS